MWTAIEHPSHAPEVALMGVAALAPAARRGPPAPHLAANTPSGPPSPPLLLAKGRADDLVLPAVQDRLVAGRCAHGDARIRCLRHTGLDQMSLLAPASPLAGDLITSSRERLAGMPSRDGCGPPP